MGSILHANAKTTPRIREEIKNANASIAALAKHYNLNPKTVIKWKNADSTADNKSGPIIRKSVLSQLEQQNDSTKKATRGYLNNGDSIFSSC